MSDWKIEIHEMDYGELEIGVTTRDLNETLYPGDALDPFLWALNGCICGFPLCCVVWSWRHHKIRGRRIQVLPLTKEEFVACPKH